MRKIAVVFPVLALGLAGVGFFAQSCGTQLGRLPAKAYGSLRSSAVLGNYAYAGNGLFLTVLDVSNPSAPAVVREIELPSEVDEGEPLVAGGYLFLPLTAQPAPARLLVYSLADPANPAQVASLSGCTNFRGGMELSGGLLYAADGSGGGLRIIDVSPPSSPALVGSLPMLQARDVALYPAALATYAYVADHDAGVHVLDVTNPAAPQELDPPVLLTVASGCEAVARSGDLLLVSAAYAGLYVFSLADPAAPALLANLDTPGYAEWTTVAGTTAYVCDGHGGLIAVDLSVPASPAVLGQIGSPGLSFHVTLSGTTALVAEDYGGLRLVDVTSPAAMAELAVWDLSEQASFGLWVEGSYAYVPRYSEGLAVLDVSAPATPSQAGLWPNPAGSLLNATVAGGVAYVPDRWQGLYTVDVTAPASPVLLGGFHGRDGYHVAVSGEHAYLAAIGDGLAILDVSDPSAPVEVGICDTPGTARWVELEPPFAFVADWGGGLRVLDVSDPASPAEVGSASTSDAARGVSVLGGRAYVSASGQGLVVFDVADPEAPVQLGVYDTPGTASRVDVAGSVAVVADGSAGVQVVDVSDPAAPTLMGTIDTPGVAQEVRLQGSRLYIADTYGVIIHDLATCCSGPPGAFGAVFPAPGASGQACSLTLDWADAPQALSYDLYLDTADPPVTPEATGLTASSRAVSLAPGTTYYWKVLANNGCGSTESSVFSFTTAPVPGAFGLISPGDGESRVLTSASFRWGASAGAQSYRLYLGTSDPPPLHAQGLTGTGVTVGGLSPGDTYYWTVVAVSLCGENAATGGPHSFTTACVSQSGRWPDKSYGPLRSLAVAGDYAYFTNGLYLTVLDISDPAAPAMVYETLLEGQTDWGEPIVIGDYLYMPLNGVGIRVYAIDAPAYPVEVATVTGFSWPLGGMEVSGSLLYVADGVGGLRILDVSNPLIPTHLGFYATSYALDVAVYTSGPATYAYVADTEEGLVVLDVSAPATPLYVTTVPMGPGTESVARWGDVLYVADGELGLRVMSLAVPAAPVELASRGAGEWYEWVSAYSNRVYACDSKTGLRVWDVTDPSNPFEAGVWDSPGYASFVIVNGSLAYLADDHAGLRILDVSAPGAIVELGAYDASYEWARGLASNGTTTFLAGTNEGLIALDVSALPAVTHISTSPATRPSSLSRSVTLRGNLALVAEDWGGLRLLDVTDPAAPVYLGGAYLDYSAAPRHSAVRGNDAYVSRGGSGFDVLDISDPSAPVILGRLNTPGSAQWLALDWPYAYVADGTAGLCVADVSVPSAPAFLASAPIPGTTTGVALTDGHALTVTAGAGLRVFDVSDPSAPSEVGSYTAPGPVLRVNVSGSVAAVADRYGVRLVDVSNPTSPTLVGSFDTDWGYGDASEAIIVGNQVHVADYYGLYVEDLSGCCSGGPGPFSLVSPPDGASDQAAALRLDWTDAFWGLRYDVYLDTVNPPARLEASGVTLSRLDVTAEPDRIYFWKVVAHSPCGTTESSVFSFYTAPRDLQVSSFSDAPDPVLTGRPLTYTLSIENDSPNPATGVVVTEVLSPASGASASFDAGSSDPRWVWDPGSMTLTADVGALPPHGADTLEAVFITGGAGTLSNHATLSGEGAEPYLEDNEADTAAQVAPLAIGDRVWRDNDADGVQDPGEPGLPGVVVKLYNGGYQLVQEVISDPAGAYQFGSLTYGASYLVKYLLPSADYVFSPRDQGGDDSVDSDADPATGQTGFVALAEGTDPARWDCGMVPGALCIPPDETVFIYSVTQTPDGNHFPILHFMDPNQPRQRTGYNVYRTHNPALPHNEWPQVASDVVDMDQATPNLQWIDSTGDDPPEGQVWFYEVAAYNHHCASGGEGPW